MPTKDGKLFIVAHTGMDGGGAFLRLQQPLDVVKRAGLAETFVARPGLPMEIFEQAFASADVLIGAHGSEACISEYFATLMKEPSAPPFAWDVDDSPGNLSPFNSAYEHFGVEEVTITQADGTDLALWEDGKSGFDLERNRERLAGYEDMLRAADCLVTTQEVLRDRLLTYNKEVLIVPNYADFENVWRWRSPMSTDGKVRIMYQGGSSHWQDLQIVLPVMKAIAEDYPHVIFQFMGQVDYNAARALPAKQMEVIPWEADYRKFSWAIAHSSPDIGLCPLNMGPSFRDFNRCKSELKWLDFACLAVPTVCTWDMPYTRAVEFSEEDPFGWTGVLARTQDDWYAGISALVEDRKMRMRIGDNAYRHAMRCYSANDRAPDYMAMFEYIKGLR